MLSPAAERCPTHPGELMRDILEEHVGLTIAEAARLMGVSRQHLSTVLRAHAPVRPKLALKFARLTGGRPELFVSMQGAYDLWHQHRELAAALAAIIPVPLVSRAPP